MLSSGAFTKSPSKESSSTKSSSKASSTKAPSSKASSTKAPSLKAPSSKESSSKASSIKVPSLKAPSFKESPSKESIPKQLTPSEKSSSVSSIVSSRQNAPTSNNNNNKNRLPSPLLSDFDYVGRTVTLERPTVKKSSSLHKKQDFNLSINDYNHLITPRYQEFYEEYDTNEASSDDDAYDLNKPFGVIRINDKHYREVYRVPTPPPRTKRVYHRLQSPKPKIIERIYVRRPPQEIIENIVEVPPEKVRIINKEKYLGKSKPIVRTKVIHLKPHNYDQYEIQQQQQEQSTTFAHPPQLNPAPAEYTLPIIQSNIPYNSQQFSNYQTFPTNCLDFEPSPIPLNYSRY